MGFARVELMNYLFKLFDKLSPFFSTPLRGKSIQLSLLAISVAFLRIKTLPFTKAF